jgi:hypothetical protein
MEIKTIFIIVVNAICTQNLPLDKKSEIGQANGAEPLTAPPNNRRHHSAPVHRPNSQHPESSIPKGTSKDVNLKENLLASEHQETK